MATNTMKTIAIDYEVKLECVHNTVYVWHICCVNCFTKILKLCDTKQSHILLVHQVTFRC